MMPTHGRHVGLLTAALVLVGSVTTAAVTLGIERPPALAKVADTDPLPARIAWSEQPDLSADTCLSVLHPDGVRHRVACDDLGDQFVGWTDEGIAIVSWTGSVVAGDETVTDSWMLQRRDPATGAVLEEVEAADHGWYDVAGELLVWTERDEGQLVVAAVELTDGTPTEDEQPEDGQTQGRDDRLGGADRIQVDGNDAAVLWRVDAPSSYDVYRGALSPDRQWVVLTDNAGRYVVVPADGSNTARVWAEGVDLYAGPIWEGTPITPMHDLDDLDDPDDSDH